MGLDDRLWYLLLGCLIGFVLGYITRALRDIKEELQEVDETVHKLKDESGITRFPVVANIALALVVMTTVYAAFLSQKASNEVEENQLTIEKITKCNQMYLAKTVEALNERTTYSLAQARANVDLQGAQAELLRRILVEPPPTQEVGRDALRDYFEGGVQSYIEVNERALAKYIENPYPTTEDIEACLRSD